MIELIALFAILVWSIIVIVAQNTLILPKTVYSSIEAYLTSVVLTALVWLLGMYFILVFLNIV